MLTFAIVVFFTIGLNTLVWTVAGLSRVAVEAAGALRARRRHRHGHGHRVDPGASTPDTSSRPTRSDVAVVIAAHNEETVIEETLRAAGRLIPPYQIFVVSDGSSDQTVAIARAAGANVYDLTPNRGKAGAIVAALDYFDLAGRFEVVMLLDADTRLADDYFETGLALFDSPDVVAVAGRATTLLDGPRQGLEARILTSYRERVYIAMQFLHKFGQAARHADAVAIVPGFASMYRSRILAHIDIAAEGLTIEDYNMTFEVHAKKLGRIAFHPFASVAHTQDPDTLHDYIKQVRRWNLGFWQTLLRHTPRLNRFWAALALFVTELAVSSLVMVALVPLLMISTLGWALDAAGLVTTGPLADIATIAPPAALVLGVVLPDYALTLLAAVVAKRPGYLVLGVAYPPLRILDAWLCLRAFVQARSGTSTGVWQSPTRRATARSSVS